MTRTLPWRDIGSLFRDAELAGRVGLARKTAPVDARPAKVGEIVVTVILGEGPETRSKPANDGDMVVRNRCAATGNEQYLVSLAKFNERYVGPFGAGKKGRWREYRPISPAKRFFVVDRSDGAFVFTAPWGEDMIAKVGDAIVQSTNDFEDIYRVARESFLCTYEIEQASTGRRH